MASRNSQFSAEPEDEGRNGERGEIWGDAKSKLNRRHWRPLFNTQIDTESGTENRAEM